MDLAVMLVTTGFFSDASLVDGGRTSNIGRGRSSCKYAEFFVLWFQAVKHFLAGERIYVVDNGSPFPLSRLENTLGEKPVYIDRQDYILPDASFVAKRFNERHSHAVGSIRQFADILLMCYHNNEDLLFIEGDSVIGFDPRPQISDKDFWVDSLHHDWAGIWLMYISHDKLRSFRKNGRNLQEHIHYIENTPEGNIYSLDYKFYGRQLDKKHALSKYADHAYANISFEGFYYSDFFCKTDASKRGLRQPNSPYIHDANKRLLKNFITKYLSGLPYSADYLSLLDSNYEVI